MAGKTCIVGGGAAGSGEHIFPASLGGLRVNNGIYCGKHNNAYGALAAVLTEQLAFLNAQLGIRNSRTKQVRPVTLTDPKTGEAFEFSGGQLKPTGPRVLSKDDKSAVIAVASMADLPAFLAEQKAKDVEYQVTGPGVPETYIPGELHTQVGFGGPQGLRAIGYIAQTFFAHCFQVQARDTAMQPFIDYTLDGVGNHFVWWDFDAPTLSPNKFSLGHRITVGVDAELGTAYARVSLFSTLDFAMVFCKLVTAPASSASVVNDIDPLALRMPDDLDQTRETHAVASVTSPANQTEGLSSAIANGSAATRMTLLMKRAEDHNLRLDSEELLEKLDLAPSATAKGTVLREFWDAEPQRVWRLLNAGLTNLRARSHNEPLLLIFASTLEQATERDPASATGVTPAAKTAMNIAAAALAKEMAASLKSDALDRDKTEMFIGGGVGAEAAVRAVLSHKFPKFGF